MKRLILGACLAAIFVIAVDCLLAMMQASSLRREVGKEDFLAALDVGISVGMYRSEVEKRIVGYRQVDEMADQGQLIVSYDYWFGFLPPIGLLRFKIAGGLIVTYSADERVIDSTYWNN